MDNLRAIAEILVSQTGNNPFDMEVIEWQLYLHKLEMWDDEKQIAALDSIVEAVRKVGSKRYLVDGVRPWRFRNAEQMASFRKRMRAYCEKKGIVSLEFSHLWEAEKADTSGWRPLKEDIHMCTPGHIFYAKELLKFWLDQSRER